MSYIFSLVIENSCGEMNAVGGSFSQLKQIINKVTDKSRIGICLDTCHAFASGRQLDSFANIFPRFVC